MVRRRGYLRLAFGAIAALIAIAGIVTLDARGLLTPYIDDSTRWTVLVIVSLAYSLLLAVPFVPGVELGWTIIGLFGIPGIFAAWLGTTLGLCLGYYCGRRWRQSSLPRRLLLARGRLLEVDPQGLTPTYRLLRHALLFGRKHPYLALMLLLNLPGNWLVGGGGGVAWISGTLPEYRFARFALAVTAGCGVIPVALLAAAL